MLPPTANVLPLDRVTPFSVLAPLACRCPLLMELSVPPLIVAVTWTVPAFAVMAPVLLTVLLIGSVPLPVASSSPALVTVPPPFRVSVPLTFALTRAAKLVVQRQAVRADHAGALDRVVGVAGQGLATRALAR